MKLSIMQEFIRLADNKNFSKTAEELYMAQSALSRHIAALEGELGVRLIVRSKNSFQLTPEGILVREKFETIINEYQDVLYQLSLLSKKESGEIHVGILYYDMSGYGAKIRETFRRLYPDAKLVLHSYQPKELEENIFNGTLDVGILYSVDFCRRPEILHYPFLKIPFQLIVDREDSLAAREEVSLRDLNGRKVLGPDVPFELCRTDLLLSEMIKASGIQFSGHISVFNYDEVPYLLRETNAIYLSPMANSSIYGEQVKCYYPEPDRFRSDVSAVWLKKNHNPLIPLFCNAVKICYPC